MTLDFYDSCILRLSISFPFSHVLSVVLPILQDFSRVDIHPLLFQQFRIPRTSTMATNADPLHELMSLMMQRALWQSA